MSRNKAQMTIIGLIMVFITLLVLAVMMPMITATIPLLNLTAGSFEDVLSRLIVPVLLLSVILSILVYTRPQREEYA